MLYVVDRLEGNFAICEDETGFTKDIPLSSLPEGIKEGMGFIFENGKFMAVNIPKERKDRLMDKMNRLWKE